MKFRYVFLIVLFSSFLLSGCSIKIRSERNRSITEIKLPEVKEQAQDNGKEIFVKLPIDQRLYEENPIDNNVPSLNPKKSQTASAKERAYGRKSDIYNRRLGDILLPRNQTVSLVVQQSLEQAFLQKGFKIIKNESDINEKTYIVNTDIVNFWSWKQPDSNYIEMQAEILTNLTISSLNGVKKQPVFVKVIHRNAWDYPMKDAVATYIDAVKKTTIID